MKAHFKGVVWMLFTPEVTGLHVGKYSFSEIFKIKSAQFRQLHMMSLNDKFPLAVSESVQFGRFRIPPEHVIYSSPSNLSRAIVNLRPIVPNHLLVLSTRVAAHLSDLTPEEYIDLWNSVRVVQDLLRKSYPDSNLSFNVAVQDGSAAGQSVPHVHVHILPRHEKDIYNADKRNDDVYQDLQDWCAGNDKPNANLEVLSDDQRRDRTFDEMAQEASSLRQLIRD